MEIASKLGSKHEEISMAVLFGEKCGLLFALSDYEEVSFILGDGKQIKQHLNLKRKPEKS